MGLVVIILAAVLAGGGFGTFDFAAVIVLPALLMLAFMHQGAPPRRVFAVRGLGALAGWAVTWLVLIPLFLFLYYAAFSGVPPPIVFTVLAVLAGVILGLVMAAVDRLGRRLQRTEHTRTGETS